jgi:hypothetical protein
MCEREIPELKPIGTSFSACVHAETLALGVLA